MKDNIYLSVIETIVNTILLFIASYFGASLAFVSCGCN